MGTTKNRKSAAIGLAVLGIAGLSLASAATLSLAPGTLQAGTQDLDGCQGTTPVAVDFDSTWGAEASHYVVGAVDLSGFDPACAGAEVGFTLLDDAGAALFTSTGTSAAGAVSVDVSDQAIAAETVHGVAVVIN